MKQDLVLKDHLSSQHLALCMVGHLLSEVKFELDLEFELPMVALLQAIFVQQFIVKVASQ